MTPEQISLVQSSFAKVAPIAEQAASLFYDRLFAIAPQVKQLFKGDMAEQGRKLMVTLAVVVNGLADLKASSSTSALARRHTTYGVKPSHYATVGRPCCGPWKRAWEMRGMPTWQPPGPLRTKRCRDS